MSTLFSIREQPLVEDYGDEIRFLEALLNNHKYLPFPNVLKALRRHKAIMRDLDFETVFQKAQRVPLAPLEQGLVIKLGK